MKKSHNIPLTFFLSYSFYHDTHHPPHTGVQPFETQKTYQYSYSVETATFVNDSNSQDRPRDAAVLRIQCNVEFVASSSCEVFLRVSEWIKPADWLVKKMEVSIFKPIREIILEKCYKKPL